MGVGSRVSSIERLENRTLLSVSVLLIDGGLDIVAGATDNVTVRANAGGLVEVLDQNGLLGSLPSVSASAIQAVTITGGDSANVIDLSGVTAARFSALTSIQVSGGDGGDRITGSPDLANSLNGGDGADTLVGQAGNDTLNGGNGADSILGGLGDDSLLGGDGADTITGDDGDDTIVAGNSSDTVDAGNGSDSVEGNNGEDSLVGGTGDDTLNGDGGSDTISGSDGNDSILGGESNDRLLGDAGNDTIDGQAGDDTVDGGADDDSMLGGTGFDLLAGGTGQDSLNGGADEDTLVGGTDNDSLLGGSGNDSLFGDEVTATASSVGNDVLNGQSGNDSLDGGGGNDRLDGGVGNDVLRPNNLDLSSNGLTLSIDDVMLATEGNFGITNLTVTVHLSRAISELVTVNYETTDDTAVAGVDFIRVSGTLAFAAGQISRTITIPVLGDTVEEFDETFFVALSSATGAAIADSLGIAAIFNDDGPPELRIDDVTVAQEGDSGSLSALFTVRLSAPSPATVFVNFATQDGTATAGLDYLSSNGTLMFPPNSVSQTLTVPILGDVAVEFDLNLFVNLSLPINATISDAQGHLTIVDDDTATVGLYGIGPFGSATTPMTLFRTDPATGATSTIGATGINGFIGLTSDERGVFYAIDQDTGSQRQLYTLNPRTGAATPLFGLGRTTRWAEGDLAFDQATNTIVAVESFTNKLFRISLATQTMNLGNELTIGGNTIPGSDFNGLAFRGSELFAIITDNGGALEDHLVKIDTSTFEVSDVVALGEDVGGIAALTYDPSRDVFYVAGRDQSVLLEINATTLTVTLGGATGRIDISGLAVVPTVPPGVSINDATLNAEGATGTITNLDFTVTLTAPSMSVVSVDFETGDVSAMANADYQATTGTVTFPVGTTTQTIRIRVNGDNISESDESFFVNLRSPTNRVLIVKSRGVGLIRNDDPPLPIAVVQAVVLVNDVVISTETNSGLMAAVVTLSLSTPATLPVTINFSTADGTAVAGRDYIARASSITIPTGGTSGTATISIIGDTRDELAEFFTVNLLPGSNAVLTATSLQVSIRDDDGPTFSSPNDVLLIGGDGNDTLNAGFGNDTVNGGAGNDSLSGADGNDTIFGGSGADTLNGDAGDDTLNGQGGDDSVDGGLGNDSSVFEGASGGTDILTDAEGDNTLLVSGTGAANTFTIGQDKHFLLTVTESGRTATVSPTFSHVILDAGNGADTINIGDISNVPAIVIELHGGAGNDTIIGTGSPLGRVRLLLNGGADNDTIRGTLGDDTILGGDGNDNLKGGGGNDTISAQDGNDLVDGEDGDDFVDGGIGADSLRGGAGNDTLSGGNDFDTLDGGTGNDSLDGGSSVDSLLGNAGNDTLVGGVGADTLDGGDGNDVLDGGYNSDSILGGAGDDKIRGDHGNDTIDAGDGHDTVNGGDGNDVITGGMGNDILNGADGDDFINGGAGNDFIAGGDGKDTLKGGAGNDIVLGEDGNDLVDGQGGTDTVAGNQGSDVIADPASEINETFVLSAGIRTQLDAA